MGKELILKTLRHEKTDEIPWVPFAGVHAGQLKGFTAEEMLTNADNIVESLVEVNKLYMPDGLPVLFDLQVEAEILGCDLLLQLRVIRLQQKKLFLASARFLLRNQEDCR